MADVESDAFTALEALYTADTGAGGLAQAAGSARASAFLRARDREQVPGYPHIVVDIQTRRMPSQGVDSYDLIITMEVVDLWKRTFTREDAVADRIETVFSNVTPADSAAWKWCPLWRRQESPSGRRGDHRFKRIQYHMTATAV